MSRNLIARISVAAVAIPIILWICYSGGWWLFGMLALFASVGIYEFLSAEGYRPRQPVFVLTILAVWVIYVSLAAPQAYIEQSFAHSDAAGISGPFWVYGGQLVAGIAFLLVVLLGGMLFSIGKRSPAELFGAYTRLLWAVFYLGVLYGLVAVVDSDWFFGSTVEGGDRLLFLFGLLWVGDTSAMWVGSAIGKHKLAPAVSPNKTVEGFLGGILGSLAIGALMVFWKFSDIPWYHVLIIALGCSVFGQLGDLTESMWKRSIGIKDSSAIIPGHGGVLDRFDSLLFAAPFMLFYMLIFGL